MPTPAPTIPCVPITSTEEGQRLATHFLEVVDALIGMVQEETELVRGGRLGAAAKLSEPKADLTQAYLSDTLRLRASQPHLSKFMSATERDLLRQRHDDFRAILEINLTVLATAHAVSEGIVRGVSDDLARHAAPQTYGASGRAVPPARSAARPLAFSRAL
jgi:hypothetical protein